MRRLSATPGLVAGALVFAAGTWWLASVALLQSSGFAGVSELSTRATAILIISQWIMIALFTAPFVAAVDPRGLSVPGNLLAATLPLWPLLALLWLTSRLSVATLILAQLGALLIASGFVLLGRYLASTRLSAESIHLLSGASAIIVASIIFAARTPFIAWLSP